MSKKAWIIVAVVIAVLFLWSALHTMSSFMGRKMVENVMERATDGKADVKVNSDGTMDIKTDDGTFSMGKDLPKDWPTDVPSYAGATITYSAAANPTDTEKAGMALILSTTDDSVTVTKFYEAELKSNGWKITNTMQGGGTTIMTAEKDERQLSLAISESDDQTGITIAVEAAK